MSLILVDLGYLGIKTCFYVSKYIGITTFNIVAYMSGSPTLEYFSKTKEDILIDEVKNLKSELIVIKELMGTRPQDTIEYIYIDEIEDDEDDKDSDHDKKDIKLIGN